MEFDVYNLKVQIDNSTTEDVQLKVYEESPENPELIRLELITSKANYCAQGEYYFETLQDLRKSLESENIHLLCNGSVRNIYPSAMMVSMGCSKAYRMTLGQPALNKDIVEDIFNDDLVIEYSTVDEQEEFFQSWINYRR